MTNGYGRGSGGGAGLGFRGSSPPWPYVGQGRGGLPRCGYYFRGLGPVAYQGPWSGRTADYGTYSPPASKEDELGYLKDQAAAIKEDLARVEARINDLEKEKH
jgi:hypothetical protein